MHGAHRQPQRPAAGWDAAAPWYREHLREEGTLLREVVYPNALRMLGPMHGKRVVDVACGEGTFAQLLAKAGATVLGVDASPILIRAATAKRIPRAEFVVGDARRIAGAMRAKKFDAAVSLMALANMDPMEQVFAGVAAVLASHAPFVVVLAHPCFRIPRQSGWGWDLERKLQYRRVDRYLTPMRIPIQAHPGARPDIVTTTYHRPLAAYVAAAAAAGFAVTGLEEWSSDRASTSGPKARAENLARREIPVFLAIRFVRQ